MVGSEKKQELANTIEELVSEIQEINDRLYRLAQHSTSGGKIKYDQVNWQTVDELSEKYEIWFNQSQTLVREYIPERKVDFESAYGDMDEFIHFDGMEYTKVDRYGGLLHRTIARQKNILLSIPSKLEIEQLKVRKTISSEIIIEEIFQAKNLWDDNNTRAAGVVAGVALERHLLTLCEVSERELDFDTSDGIRSLAETLYQAGEITETKMSQLGYLAGTRNDCAHVNDDEPDKRDVERLIQQTEDIVREL